MTVLFTLLVVFLYFFNLGLNAVWIPNEAFYADASRRMLETGDLLTPVYNGELRLNKPPMTYWLSTLSFFLLGVNEFALRFFQALLGLGTAFLTYRLTLEITGRRETAFLSFLVLSLSFIFVANARYTSPEVPLTFFITLSLYLWYRYYTTGRFLFFFLALLSSVFGVLTKGPVGFVLPAGIIFFFLLLEKPRELLKLRYYAGTLFVFLASGWWYLYQYLTNGEEFLRVFIKENIKRIYALQSDPFYQYLLDVNVSFLPYSFLVFPAVLYAFRRRELRFPLVWVLTVFVVFSMVKMKIPVYVMPAYPAMAVLTAVFLNNSAERMPVKVSLYFLGGLLFLAFLVVAFAYDLSLPWLLVGVLISFVPLYFKRPELLPASGGIAFLLYLSAVVLPFVEEYRPYREVGRAVKKADPAAELRTYELFHFHHNLPFYAERRIIRNRKPSKVQPPALVLAPKGLYPCREVLGSWRLYTRSESRFFKFLMDVKRNKNFREFVLCRVE